MNTSSSLQLTKVLSWDIVILTAIYFVPTLSHLTSFPLYLFDPMRFAVLGSLLFLRDYKNTFFLAASLPLFSYFIGGHPVFLKSVLISMELMVNVALLLYLKDKVKPIFGVVLASIVISKIFYYMAKYALISFSLLDADLLATPLLMQVVVALLISVSFSLIYKERV